MATLRDLRTAADHRLFAGDYHGALQVYCAIVQLDPTDLDARLRVADSLLALGEVQRAAVVYTALARHAMLAGYPLRALIALKVLAALEPQLAGLLAPLAELYSVESKRLGRSVRVVPGNPDREVPPNLDLTTRIPIEQLAPHAERVASEFHRLAYPETLPPIPLFSELSAEAFGAVLRALKLRRVRPGEVVIAEGEPGQSFFVVARGEVQVVRGLTQNLDGVADEIVLATLHDGAIFGEMALVSAAPRSATVRAVRDTDLLEFDREALAAASREVTTVAIALDKFTRERLLHNLLHTSPLFRPLDRQQRFELIRRFTAHDVAPGVEIIREGQPGRGLFVLLAGEVDVSKRDGASKVLLATLKPGDIFGEISLLHDEPATATVTAARQSTVLFLAKEIFHRLCAAVPEIREYVSQLSEQRLMDTRLLLGASGSDVEELRDEDLVLV
jgi:CRP-like cAMP-binding protein